MASGFGTEIAQMETASKHVLEVNSQMQSELKRLQGQIEPLVGQWRGAAQVSFMNLMRRWDENAQKLNVALNQIAESLSQSKTAYEQQDQAQQSSFGAIGGALG